jgi:hypothetical protein
MHKTTSCGTLQPRSLSSYLAVAQGLQTNGTLSVVGKHGSASRSAVLAVEPTNARAETTLGDAVDDGNIAKTEGKGGPCHRDQSKERHHPVVQNVGIELQVPDKTKCQWNERNSNCWVG